jgi:hypothetical protein
LGDSNANISTAGLGASQIIPMSLSASAPAAVGLDALFATTSQATNSAAPAPKSYLAPWVTSVENENVTVAVNSSASADHSTSKFADPWSTDELVAASDDVFATLANPSLFNPGNRFGI